MTTDTHPAAARAARADLAAAAHAARFGGIGHGAALRAIQRNTSHVRLPWGLGGLALPSREHLAFFAGLAVIAGLGLVDWPVVAVLAAGHLLAEDHHHRLLRDFGQALEEA